MEMKRSVYSLSTGDYYRVLLNHGQKQSIANTAGGDTYKSQGATTQGKEVAKGTGK